MLFKIVAVGPRKKSALLRRYADGTFRETYIPTHGVDFATKNVKVGKQIIRLVIFDTWSQGLLDRLRPYYYQGATGAIVCYDITSRRSFKALESWMNEIDHHLGKIPRILVGMYVELTDPREVPIALAEAYAQEKEVPYIEVSAKTGEGIEEMFLVLTHKMLEALYLPNDKPPSME